LKTETFRLKGEVIRGILSNRLTSSRGGEVVGVRGRSSSAMGEKRGTRAFTKVGVERSNRCRGGAAAEEEKETDRKGEGSRGKDDRSKSSRGEKGTSKGLLLGKRFISHEERGAE